MMAILALARPTESEKNLQLVLWVALILGAVAVYRGIRWFFAGPVRPEPWSNEVATELEQGDAQPLCCHCLEPHAPDANFCPDCGAPVGQYTNWLPFPYLFSIGHLLRTGTSGDFKRTPLTVIGFLLLGLIEYTIFAPVYWVQLLLGIRRRPDSPAVPPPMPADSRP